MPSRGYFTIAQGQEYIRMAYGLALSLKNSQKTYNKLSIGVTKEEIATIPAQYREVFDEIVEIPWDDHAKNSSWKLENEWKAIHMTPYDETIKLDADMLFLNDVSGWWDNLALSDGVFCTKPRTYRDELITNDYYRKTFTESNLPNIYTALFYFKKNDINFELFSHAEFIFNNWQRCFYEFLEADHRPKVVSTDVVFAIAAKIMDYQQYNVLPTLNMPTFVHMKSQLQNWPTNQFMSEDWMQMIGHYFSRDCQLRIGNYQQLLPIHYHVKSFLSQRMIVIMEKRLGV